MDSRLLDGDQALDSRGLPAQVEGDEELLQQAMIRLAVKKGSLVQDPALGSRLHELKRSGIPRMEQLALGYAQDALSPMRTIQAQSVRCVYHPENDTLSVVLTLLLEGREERLSLSL